MSVRRTSVVRAWWWRAAAALPIVSHIAAAQEVRGTVSDSTTRQPVAGAVVSVLDSAGTTRGRAISNERGQYRVSAPPGMRRLRVVRMGFRPSQATIPQLAAGVVLLDVAMAPLPTMLETIRVLAGASCPRRSDRDAALALLEQARAALLTAVVARETHRATSMILLNFRRTMDGTSSRIERQMVTIDSSAHVSASYQAVRTAREFVRDGFVVQGAHVLRYFGPDADVLLDDAFSNGYCFHLRGPDAARTNQVGLAFTPASRRRGRVDVDGTLWVDTAAHALRDIEFRYLGLPAAAEAAKPGGGVSFWEMKNGVVLIDRWSFRTPAVARDTTYPLQNNGLPVIREWIVAHETGGEVASATWPDGYTYQAPLGFLHARAVDLDGKPVTGTVVRLLDTDYLASPGADGYFAIGNLLPGPYTAVIVDPSIAHLGIVLPTALRFSAVRDSVSKGQLLVPVTAEFVRTRCTGDRVTAEKPAMLVVSVESPSGKPLSGVRWRLSKDTGVPWQLITETRTTGTDGLVHYCLRLEEGDEVEVRVWREGEPIRISRARLSGKRTTVRVRLP